MILTAICIVGGTGMLCSTLLYFISRKFEVAENPLLGEVQSALPAANCGGCGYPGCGAFASACVNAASLDGLLCPVGGAAVMEQVASILGKTAAKVEPRVAVLRCNGNCSARPRTNLYDGARSCRVAAQLYGGETGCSYGCLGHGDCEVSCSFGAIVINKSTGLPEVDDNKCTACGACVKACPKNLIELRRRGPKSRRVYVSCMNRDKGGPARKACSNACIGCGKCARECAFDAITVANNLAFIDSLKCRLCRKCAPVCPTGAIIEANFPVRKEAVEAKES